MKISAGFTKKVMIKQYEPVEVSCFIEEEYGAVEGVSDSGERKEIARKYSDMFKFCKDQVEKRIELELRLIDSRKENQHKQKVDVAIELGQEDIIGE